LPLQVRVRAPADVCSTNIGAEPADGGWAATSAAEDPAWRNGWAIGSKVTAERGGVELHAPDRVTSTGDPDYYWTVVGAEPVPTGSAVVEDDVAPAESEDSRPSPGPSLLAPLAVLALAALARHR
jgi:MYXO-CTERM domain-containing protein